MNKDINFVGAFKIRNNSYLNTVCLVEQLFFFEARPFESDLKLFVQYVIVRETLYTISFVLEDLYFTNSR